MTYNKTVDAIDINEFMGKWYVIAARPTFLEKGAHNAIEIYTWNEKEKRIDIDFTLRKNGFDGELKKIPQKAWIYNEETNAHWKVQPFWPLKFDYLVIAHDQNGQWTVIGVPNENYVWIMARQWSMNDEQLDQIITQIDELGYKVQDIQRIPQNGGS